MSSFSDAQISEISQLVLELVPPGSEMMENFEEVFRGHIDAKMRAKYAPAPFMGTCVMPTSDQLKLVDFDLPFMPQCVRYIGCKVIKLNGGRMTPCGNKVKDSDYCVTCLKKANGAPFEFGTLDERMEAHDNGVKYSAGGKTEITYGDFLAAKKKTREEAKAAIRKAGLSLNIPEECFARSATAKKRSGRPKKNDSADAETADAAAEIVEEAPKPKVKKPPMTLEERIEKLKADEEKRKEKEAAAAVKKAEREKLKAEREKLKAEQPPKEKKPRKKATKEDVSQMLSSLSEEKAPEVAETQNGDNSDDEDNNDASSLNGDSDDEEEEVEEVVEEEEVAEVTFEKVRVKGLDFLVNDATKEVYALDEDGERSAVIGAWMADKNSINFNVTHWAKAIIEDQITIEAERHSKGKITADKKDGRFLTRFYVDGAVFAYDHVKKELFQYKGGKVVWKNDGINALTYATFQN